MQTQETEDEVIEEIEGVFTGINEEEFEELMKIQEGSEDYQNMFTEGANYVKEK